MMKLSLFAFVALLALAPLMSWASQDAAKGEREASVPPAHPSRAEGARKALRVDGRVYLVMPEAMRKALVASSTKGGASARINGIEVAARPASIKTPYNVMRVVDAAGVQAETMMDDEAKAAAQTMGLPKGRSGYPGRALLRLDLEEGIAEVEVVLPGEAAPLKFRVARRKP